MPHARTILRIVVALFAVLVLAAVAIVGYTVHVMHEAFEASGSRARAALAAHRQEFMDDQRWLASLPMFAPRAGSRDAGPLIGPRLHWTLAAPRSADPRALDRSAIDKLADDWVRAGPDVWGAIELGWMAHLADFDYWDVDRNSVPQARSSSRTSSRMSGISRRGPSCGSRRARTTARWDPRWRRCRSSRVCASPPSGSRRR